MSGVKGRSGRRPKPTHLHVLDGTLRKDRHSKRIDAEYEPTSDGKLPPPPSDLSDAVRKEWARQAETLTFKIWTVDDIRSFATYCALYRQWQEAYDTVEEEGITSEVETKDGRTVRGVAPHTKVWMDLTTKLQTYFDRYGMNPVSRARIKETDGTHNKPKEKAPEDEFKETEEG